ncbi:MAG: cation:proton antiporter [Campylobacterota bacterium]|nr:cation:proton antiporter [Campylobacterota bacterium]
MESVLYYVLSALAISVVINIFLKKMGISQIIGYIVTGTILVYAFDLRHMTDSHTLELIAEFGIVFLMFTIGLEISLAKMNTMREEIFFNGSLQVTISAVLFYLFAHYFFEIDVIASVIIALALALSSTAVVLTHLKNSKEIYLPYGQRSVGVLVFQDLAVIPILLFLGFLSSEGLSIEMILLDTFLSAIVVIGSLFIFGKRAMTWLLRFSAESGVEELFMGSVFVIVIGASLFAHFMGFTYSLGAFVAGMIIAETKYYHKVEADIAPFKDLLLGTFFITVGMKIDLMYFVNHAAVIVLTLLMIFILKAVIIFFILLITSAKDTALKSALTLSQIGEFSFAIFAVASSYELIDKELIQILILMVVLSMILTPFLISKVNEIVIKIFKEEVFDNNFEVFNQRSNHIILCGYGTYGRIIAEKLEKRGLPYIVVDNNLKQLKWAINDSKEAYFGDLSKKIMLDALHVEDAATVILAVDNLEKKRLICEAVTQHAKDVNLVVEAHSSSEKEYLSQYPISKLIYSQKEVAKIMVDATMQCRLD